MKKLAARLGSLMICISMLIPMSGCKKKVPVRDLIKEDDPFFSATTSKLTIPIDDSKILNSADVSSMELVDDYAVVNFNIFYNMPEEAMDELMNLDYSTDEGFIRSNEIYAEYYVSGFCIYNLDGSVRKAVRADGSWSVMATICEGKDGTFWMLCEYIEAQECMVSYAFCNYDRDGNLISKMPVDDVFYDVYPNQIILLDDDSFLVIGYGGYVRFSADGKCLYTILRDDVIGSGIYNAGKCYIQTEEYEPKSGTYSLAYRELDLETGTVSDNVRNPLMAARMSSIMSDGTNFYYINSSCLERVDITTNKTEKILEWNDTDINFASIYSGDIRVLSDDEIVIGKIVSKFDPISASVTSDVEVTSLKRAEKNPHAGKSKIQIGSMGFPSDGFCEYIVCYNTDPTKESRICLYDYLSDLDYDNYEKTIADISDEIYQNLRNGTGPDILADFSQFFQFNNEELLVDLNKYIDGKGGLDRSAYFDNVLRAFESNGKLYSIPVCFDVSGLLGNKNLVGERTGWTFSEFNQIVSELPEGMEVIHTMYWEDLLDSLLSGSMNHFVDYKRQKTYFEGDEFKQILEITKRYGTTERDMGDPYWVDPSTLLKNGKTALISAYLYNVAQYADNAAVCKDDAIYLGVPSTDGTGMIANPMLTLSISAFSTHKEEAWEFIKSMFSPDQQYEYSNSFSSIPLSREAFERISDESLQNRNHLIELYGEEYVMNTSMTLITQEDIDGFCRLVESVSTIPSADASIMIIVMEEVRAYIEDEKTIDEVCESIQKKTTAIVHER